MRKRMIGQSKEGQWLTFRTFVLSSPFNCVDRDTDDKRLQKAREAARRNEYIRFEK